MSRVRAATDRWRAVAWSMGVGCLYDLAFGVAILFFHRKAGAWLGLQPPDDPTYLRLCGVLLLLVAGMYALPAFSPSRYRGVVGVAIVGRTIGFLYLAGVHRAGGPVVFLGLGLADLAFAAVHALLLLRARERPIAANP